MNAIHQCASKRPMHDLFEKSCSIGKVTINHADADAQAVGFDWLLK